MRQSQPPDSATWILEHFAVSENSDALVGDLFEHYRAGRSAGWYWRQVVVAVLVGTSKTVLNHKLLAVRAITVWLVTDYLYNLFWWSALWHRYSFSIYLFRHHLGPWAIGPWATILNVLLVSTFTGWIVALYHRRHRVAMVLVCAVGSNLRLAYFIFPVLWMHLVDSVDQPRFRPYLVADIALFIAITAGFILGGVIFWPRRNPASTNPATRAT
jgi:hypothetical protein